MITKLTKEQESRIPEYIDKWIKQASMPMNHTKAIEYTREMYKAMGEKEPLIIFGYSPMNTALLCALFFALTKSDSQDSQLGPQLSSQLRSQLGSQLGSQLDSQLRSQLSPQLRSQLGSQLRSQLDSQLRSQLSSQLRSQLSPQLDSQLSPQLGSQLEGVNKNWYSGIWWLSWCGWYEYAKFIGVGFDKEKYDLFMGFNSEVSFIIPYKNVCFISEKPVNIHWKDRRLHNEKGLAVEYSDGYGLWELNGIAVPKWLVETPAEKIDPKLALDEKNADVQREIIRKIGYERILRACNAKTIDEWSCPKTELKYKVQLMNVGSIKRRYLCYEHASIPGVFYAKCMPPEAETIVQMRAFQTGVFGFNPEKAREGLRNNKLTDDELLAELPEVVQ